MRRSVLTSPIWLYVGFVLIGTAACVSMALSDDRLTTGTMTRGAIIWIAVFLIMGLLYRRKNALTRLVARQFAVLGGTSQPEDEEVDRIQDNVVRSAWVLFLGLIPAVGLLLFTLLG